MSERLSKSDWIALGLRALADEGSKGLNVGPMAAALNVSRGSFYWHFRDIADFRAQLLQSWQEEATDRVIRDLDARDRQVGRLQGLLRNAFARGRKLDRAIRAWAATDADAADIVADVDRRRIEKIATLLVEAGVAKSAARHRAAFLYWAYLGQAVTMAPGSSSIPAAALDDICALFES